MADKPKPKSTRKTFNFAGVAWTVALCWAVVASYAFAQPTPPEPQAQQRSEPPVQPAVELPAPPVPETTSQPTDRPEGQPPAKSGCGGGQGGDLQPNEGAKWVCAQPTILLEPVYSGASLTCEFQIRNEGTADLDIKAKGG
ncbi:MAG: hypothetical protein V2A79_04990 [Planctomycetota bacterium]